MQDSSNVFPVHDAPDAEHAQRTNVDDRSPREVLATFRRHMDAHKAAARLANIDSTRDKNEKVSALKSKLDVLKGHLSTAFVTISDRDAELEALKAKLQSVLTEQAAVREQMDILNARVQTLESDVSASVASEQKAIRRNQELEENFSALAGELKHFKMREAVRADDQNFNLTNLLRHLPSEWDKADLEDERLAEAKKLVDEKPNSPEAGLAIKQALMAVLTAWGDEMKAVGKSIEEFKKDLLPHHDSRIEAIKKHKPALAQLTGDDLINWHEAVTERRRVKWAMEKVVSDSKLTYQAIHTAYKSLNLYSKVHVIDSAIFVAYRMRKQTLESLDSVRISDYWSLENTISRTQYAVQDAIKALVAKGTRYEIDDDSSEVSTGTSPGISSIAGSSGGSHSTFRFEIPEPPAMSSFADSDNFGCSLEPSAYDDAVVNSANGLPMIGGMAGVDIHGNPFGTDWM
ncbi:hypothetical protein [Paraburkholderia hospita]|nr:hypothetical protein [Paraburkholderia hospita]